MKRLYLALGIGAAAMAISTPASAQSGCKWYDVNCRIATGDVRNGDVRTGDIITGRRVDGSWQLIGRDANGNAIYQRRRVDGNGNVVIERARRDARGNMIIIDRDITNRTNRSNRNVSRRYEKNGMICTYKENSQGYHEKCKYAKNRSGGLYRIDRDDDDRYRASRNRANRSNSGVYRTNRVNGDKYERARGNSDKYRRNGRGRGDG
jgi:hypothetical protein